MQRMGEIFCSSEYHITWLLIPSSHPWNIRNTIQTDKVVKLYFCNQKNHTHSTHIHTHTHTHTETRTSQATKNGIKDTISLKAMKKGYMGRFEEKKRGRERV